METIATFAAAVAANRSAQHAADDFYNTVEKPGRAAWIAAQAALPHYQTTNSYLNFEGQRVHWSTANAHQPDTARSILAKKADEQPKTEDAAEYLATLREIVELDDKRRAQLEQLLDVHRIGEMLAQSEVLAEAAGAALANVLAYPVASIVELAEKIEFIDDHDEWDGAKGNVAADIRRLAIGGAA